jgi:hypothetical protein
MLKTFKTVLDKFLRYSQPPGNNTYSYIYIYEDIPFFCGHIYSCQLKNMLNFSSFLKMAEDECDLEALLDVLEEEDDFCGDALAVSEEIPGPPQEDEGEDEEEIQRQLQEMEAKMKAMKEKLNKKAKTAQDGSEQTAGGPLKTAGSGGVSTLSPAAADARPSLPRVSEIDAFRNGRSLLNIL